MAVWPAREPHFFRGVGTKRIRYVTEPYCTKHRCGFDLVQRIRYLKPSWQCLACVDEARARRVREWWEMPA